MFLTKASAGRSDYYINKFKYAARIIKANQDVRGGVMKFMKAVILCGGRGTRLRDETEFKPKPLIEIGGMPILWHIMKIYSHYGVKDFVLCLGYKGQMIKDFFLNLDMYQADVTFNTKTKNVKYHSNKKPDEWNITFAETGLDTGTGGRIKKIEKYIGEDSFFLTYGDGVSDVDISKLHMFHKKHGKTATVTAVTPLAKFGVLQLQSGMVVDFTKRDIVHGSRIDGGYFVFKKQIFDYLTMDNGCMLEDKPLKMLAKDKLFVAYMHNGFWQCMDIQQQVDMLNELWQKNQAPWKVWKS